MTGPADPDPGGVLRNFGCAKQYAKHCKVIIAILGQITVAVVKPGEAW